MFKEGVLVLLGQFFVFRSNEHAPSIARAAALEFAVTFAYTLLVAIAANDPDSPGGQLLTNWIAGIDALIKWLSMGLPASSGAGGAVTPGGAFIYRHILAVSLAVTAISFVGTRRYWDAWSRSISSRLRPAQSSARNRVMLIGHRICGARISGQHAPARSR